MNNNEKGKKMAMDFSDFVNSFSTDKEGFVEEINRTHRTLQQSMFRIIIDLIKMWSDMYENKRYDLRNEKTCELCNKIYKEFEKDLYVPFI